MKMKTRILIAFTLLTELSLIINGPFTVSAQTQWTKYPGNPVLTKSDSLFDWDMFVVGDPSVISDGDTLKMWFTGSGAIIADTTTDTTATIKPRIGYAYSQDGINWTKYSGNPVVVPSPGEWDSLAIETVTVLKDTTISANERYRMWYGGSGDPVHGLYQIGYAYSPDGIHWTKHANNPVLTSGPDTSWDNGSPEGPTVIKDNDTLKMWYAGLDTIADGQPTDFEVNIGYAWSLDGVNWTKHPDNPVLTTGGLGSWDDVTIQDPEVLKIEGVYHLWYSGFPEWLENAGDIPGLTQIGYASSLDGINWTKDTNNPVVPNGASGTWDAAATLAPAITWDGDTLHLWYTGIDTVPLPEWPEPFFWDIGYATSSLQISDVNEEQFQIIDNFSLFQNYPNPFTMSTTIEFELAVSGHVVLRLYNVPGFGIKTLVDEKRTAGLHSVVWNGQNNLGNAVPGGIYFLRMSVGDLVQTRQLLLLK